MVSQPGKTGGGTGQGGGGGVGFGGGGGGESGGSVGGRPGKGRTGGGICEQSGLHIHHVVSDCWKHTEYPYQGSHVLVSSAWAATGRTMASTATLIAATETAEAFAVTNRA